MHLVIVLEIEIGLKAMPCGLDITLNFRFDSIDDMFSEKQLPKNVTGDEYRTIEGVCEGMRTSVKKGLVVAESLAVIITNTVRRKTRGSRGKRMTSPLQRTICH